MKRMTRKGSGFKVGYSVAKPTNGVKAHSTCTDTHETQYHKPQHITRRGYEQREGVCVKGGMKQWGEHEEMQSLPPTPLATSVSSVPFVCRLKLAESSGSQGLT